MSFVNIILGTMVALLPITNPISTAALFLTITQDDSHEERRKQALRGCLYTFGILVSFLIAGTLIMNFFGISIPGLRIAGGVMVIRIAMGMMKPQDHKEVSPEAHKESQQKEDISFSPLAMPSLSGPGAIAVTIGLAAGTRSWLDYVGIIVGIVIVVTLAYLTLRASESITNFLGQTGMNALSRIMGFLLLCVGIQFVINATLTIVSDPDFLRNLKMALESAG